MGTPCREEVSLLATAQLDDAGVVGGTLGPTVPRAVVVGAVAVVLTVGVVVLLVVRDEIGQGETIVSGDEVDARRRPASFELVQIGAAREPVGELGQGRVLAPPEVANAVAVLAVPLGPLGWEVAHLVTAFTDVPRLGEELDLTHDGVLMDEVEERGQSVHVVELTSERRGQIEAEPVDVHLRDPVPQAVHHQAQHVGVAHVQRVPGACVVLVVLRLFGHRAVVREVVDAAHGEGGPHVVAFTGVVVDDVEDHLEAGSVQFAHHDLELGDLPAAGADRRVLTVGGEEPDAVVAPIVAQAAFGEV
jgi:hypothetical protein